jgi:hypothetical protein
VSGQQARHEHHQWQRNVKDDTIRQHAEPPVVPAPVCLIAYDLSVRPLGDPPHLLVRGGIGVDDRLVLQMPPGRAVPDAVIEIRSAASPFGRDRIRPISLTLVDL